MNTGVLVVDDDPITRRVLRAMMGSRGDTVMCAASGREALAILETFRPRLACIDLNMPGMGGLELITAIRSRYPTTMPVVVVLTASSDPDDATLALERGADRFLTKPVSTRQVTALVDEATMGPAT